MLYFVSQLGSQGSLMSRLWRVRMIVFFSARDACDPSTRSRAPRSFQTRAESTYLFTRIWMGRTRVMLTLSRRGERRFSAWA
jgi:hypothetical protein